MKKASTRLLEQETQTPSPAPDLIPAESSTENLHWDWYSKRGHFTAYKMGLLGVAITMFCSACCLILYGRPSNPDYLAATIRENRTPGTLRVFQVGGPKWISPRSVTLQGDVALVITQDDRILEAPQLNGWRTVEKVGLPE